MRLKIVFKKIVTWGVGGLFSIFSAASDIYVIQQGVSWIQGKKPNEESMSLTNWITFGALAVAQVPIAITVIYHFKKRRERARLARMAVIPEREEHIASSDEESAREVAYQSSDSEDQKSPTIQHVVTDNHDSWGEIGKDALTSLLAFGTISSGSTFLIMLNSLKFGIFASAGVGGTALAIVTWGCFEYHRVAAHAEEEKTVKFLYKQALSKGCGTGFNATFTIFAVGTSHLLQGFLSASPLMYAVGAPPWVGLLCSGIVSLIATGLEARTELQNGLDAMLAEDGEPASCGLLFFAGIPALIHALSSIMSPICFARAIHEQIHNEEYAEQLSAAARWMFLSASFLTYEWKNASCVFSSVKKPMRESIEGSIGPLLESVRRRGGLCCVGSGSSARVPLNPRGSSVNRPPAPLPG